MTLRARLSLLVAATSAALALAMGGAAVTVAYNTSLAAVDRALATVSERARNASAEGLSTAIYAASLQPQPIAVALLADSAPATWVRLGEDVALTTHAMAAVPALTPATVGGSRQYRVIRAGLQDGDAVLLAVDVTPLGDQRTRNLRIVLLVAALLALLAALASRAMVRRDLRRMRELAIIADRIASGDLAPDLPATSGASEVDALTRSVTRMLRTLRDSYTELEASHGQLRTFLGDVSHELRTPLTVVRGYVELLNNAERLEPEVRDRAVDRSLSEIERMQSLIADLLLLAEYTEQRQQPFATIDLTTLVQDAALDVIALQPAREIRMQLPDRPALLVGDERALQSLCANLFGNVRRHTPETAPVSVSLSDLDGAHRLVVEDGGPGLTDEQYAVPIDELERFSRLRSESTGGSGLGLRIVATIMRLHGGTLTLQRSSLGGLRVECTFPIV